MTHQSWGREAPSGLAAEGDGGVEADRVSGGDTQAILYADAGRGWRDDHTEINVMKSCLFQEVIHSTPVSPTVAQLQALRN